MFTVGPTVPPGKTSCAPRQVFPVAQTGFAGSQYGVHAPVALGSVVCRQNNPSPHVACPSVFWQGSPSRAVPLVVQVIVDALTFGQHVVPDAHDAGLDAQLPPCCCCDESPELEEHAATAASATNMPSQLRSE